MIPFYESKRGSDLIVSLPGRQWLEAQGVQGKREEVRGSGEEVRGSGEEVIEKRSEVRGTLTNTWTVEILE